MSSTTLKNLAYWSTTSLVAAVMLLGGATDTLRPPSAVAFLAHLGYPAYFLLVIGTWKLLGGLALLAPRLPRLKEWAYAGIFFDLSGASVSHVASGDGASFILFPVALLVLEMASWWLRPESRRLPSCEASASPAGASSDLAHVVA